MPLVRIAMPKGKTAEYRKAVSQGIQRALVETFNVPEDDLFQIVTEHAPEAEIVRSPSYLGIALFERPHAHSAHRQRHAAPSSRRKSSSRRHRRPPLGKPRLATRGRLHQLSSR